MTRPRRPARIAFMAVWLALWAAGMLVALWMAGAAALRGEAASALFLVVWTGFAGAGLYAGLRRMQALLGLAGPPDPPRPSRRPHEWRDGLPERRDG